MRKEKYPAKQRKHSTGKNLKTKQEAYASPLPAVSCAEQYGLCTFNEIAPEIFFIFTLAHPALLSYHWKAPHFVEDFSENFQILIMHDGGTELGFRMPVTEDAETAVHRSRA